MRGWTHEPATEGSGGAGTSWSAVGAGAGSASSRLRRDQRRKNPSRSLIDVTLGDWRATRERLRIGLVALALEKRTIDVMLPHE